MRELLIRNNSKMVLMCCVKGCNEKFLRGGNFTFHSFPRDENRRKEWEQMINRQNFHASDATKICSKHFTSDCFNRNKFGGTWLKSDAKPTLFLDPYELPPSMPTERISLPPMMVEDMKSLATAQNIPNIAKKKRKKRKKSFKDLRQREDRLLEHVTRLTEVIEKLKMKSVIPGSPELDLLKAHFEESQFERNRADNWKKLKQTAIPTLFHVSNPPSIIGPKRINVIKQPKPQSLLVAQVAKPQGISEGEYFRSDDEATEPAPHTSRRPDLLMSRNPTNKPQVTSLMKTSFKGNIKTELDVENAAAVGALKDVRTSANQDTNADVMMNIRIENVKSVKKDAVVDTKHTRIAGPTSLLVQSTIPGGMPCTYPVGIQSISAVGSTAAGRIPKALPEVVSSSRTGKLQGSPPVTVNGHRKTCQTFVETSQSTSTVIAERPSVIKTEPVDHSEKNNIERVETYAKKRRQENADNDPELQAAKKQKIVIENLGGLRLNSLIERLDILNRNLETNTCAMSSLVKAITDNSEANVRTINHLAKAITDIGSLIYSSLNKGGPQKEA